MYKIGEAAKLMRISTEALRYYERKGIIKPYKLDDSKYRYFDAQQINHMLNMQKYQKIGFSLHEVTNMFQSSKNNEVQDLLVTKQKELMHQNLIISLRIQSILLILENMQLAHMALDTPIIGKRPAIYRLTYMYNNEIISNQALDEELEKWADYSDLQFLSGFMSQNNFNEQVNFREYGFGMLKDMAETMGIEENAIVKHYHECPALLYCYEVTSSVDNEESNMNFLRGHQVVSAFLKKHKMKIAGDILTQVVYSKYEKDAFKMRHLLWIPYEQQV